MSPILARMPASRGLARCSVSGERDGDFGVARVVRRERPVQAGGLGGEVAASREGRRERTRAAGAAASKCESHASASIANWTAAGFALPISPGIAAAHLGEFLREPPLPRQPFEQRRAELRIVEPVLAQQPLALPHRRAFPASRTRPAGCARTPGLRGSVRVRRGSTAGRARRPDGLARRLAEVMLQLGAGEDRDGIAADLLQRA